jgi:hypothetical protein
LLERIAPNRGDRIANVVFFVTAAAGLAAAIFLDLIFAAILVGWLLWGEVSRLMGPGATASGPFPVLDFDTPADSLAGDESDPEPDEPGPPSGQ